MSERKHHVDMTSGPLFWKIIRFYLPLAFSYILQLLFNAADLVIIGRFSSAESLAAVGASGVITNLLINVVIGFSISANVLVGQFFGAKDYHNTVRAVHSSIHTAIIAGVGIGVIGVAMSHCFLVWTGVPEEIFNKALTYVIVIFVAAPFITVANFGSGVLRAVGDTKRPFYFLTIAGVVNVLLNIIFVVGFHWDVFGVAFATFLSQGLAAILIFRTLLLSHGAVALRINMLKFDFEMFKKIFSIGLPAGLQSSCYAISNVVIQSTINSFGTAVIAGSTAAASLEGFIYISTWSFHQTAVSFAGQNFGAKKFDRIKRSWLYCIAAGIVMLFVPVLLIVLFRWQLLSVFNADPEVIKWGASRVLLIFPFYIIIVISDTTTGAIRGLGKTLEPAMLIFFFVLVFRILWVNFVMPYHHTWLTLIFSYPLSWFGSMVSSLFMLHYFLKKLDPVVDQHLIKI